MHKPCKRNKANTDEYAQILLESLAISLLDNLILAMAAKTRSNMTRTDNPPHPHANTAFSNCISKQLIQRAYMCRSGFTIKFVV
jgi:hypothetical protein